MSTAVLDRPTPAAARVEPPEAETVDVELVLDENYRFDVDFVQEGVARLRMDEPAPLGDGAGPNASRLLAAAVANCLSASLLFCLRKARVPVTGMRTSARATLARNEKGRLRVDTIAVTLRPDVEPGHESRVARCAGLYEDFCLVTQSIRGGIDVEAVVET
ncbi:MAG: OsmC family protein [Gemmatimonadota bacterium]